ncbi:hypothetical protein MNV49_003770 [Pseudohyphozyma bogoriensis]|nr:hypothetical protein MNV49_003770 [Pseudohyphozyma bogoriensis]
MASTSTARSVAASIALVLVGLPLAYTTYTELTRHAIVRKRKRRYHNFLQSRQTSTAKLEGAEAGSSSELAGASEKQLNGEDLAEFQALFASVAVGGRWANPFDEWHEEVGMWNWAGWQLYRVFTGYFLTNNGVPPREELLEVLKVVEPDWDTLFGGGGLDESWEKVPGVDGASTPPLSVKEGKRVEVSDRTNVTWVGQSTCYVQLDSICILTDPILETRTLDSSLAPSRLLPPPLEISQLLSLQIVLISHNHFDHLHPLTILQILQHHPHALYFVPLGLAPFLIDLGVEKENIHEFDWWDSWKGEVEVDAKDIVVLVHALKS